MLTISRQPDGRRLGDFLRENLESDRWTEFRAGVAFVKRSGVQHIRASLDQFARNGGRVRMAVGVDLRGTSAEGLTDLMEALAGRGEIWVFHNESFSTFHPKVYFFGNRERAVVYVGSGNVTEGGLYTNYEAGVEVALDLRNEEQKRTYDELVATLDNWASAADGIGKRLTADLLTQLVDLGYVPPEHDTADVDEKSRALASQGAGAAERRKLFVAIGVPAAPRPRVAEVAAAAAAAPMVGEPIGFVMTLQRTDVGHGQVTAGAARRSPEVFVPLVARDYAPGFWGYPGEFREDKRKAGKMDRVGVRMRIGVAVVRVNMMTWPVKRDFRLRSETLRSAGNVGDILRLEKAPPGAAFDYYAEVIPQGTSQFPRYRALCRNRVRNSSKTFGYY